MSDDQKLNILIIEDEEDWIKKISSLLEKDGHFIHTASTYNEAIAKIRGNNFFDLICMNIVLRGEITPDWKFDWDALMCEAEAKKIAIIVITGMDTAVSLKDIYDKAIEHGVKKIFFKSDITPSELLKKVKEIIPQNRIGSVITSSQFDVFLAYNSIDETQVEAISNELKKRGLNPWIDKQQIPPGRWFQDIIQQAIMNVKSAAIFLGKSGTGKWQILELRTFISQCIDSNIPVIPVLLPGVKIIPKNLPFLKELNLVKFNISINEIEALDNLEWGITEKHPKRASSY